jgi:hypothetical protein
LRFLGAAPRGVSSGIGVVHPSSMRVSPAGGRLSAKAGYGRHWCIVNRAYSAIQSMNPCEGDAHEQYYLPRWPRCHRPRDLGVSRVALTRQDAPRTVPPPVHGSQRGRLRPRTGAGRFAVIWSRHRSSHEDPRLYVSGSKRANTLDTSVGNEADSPGEGHTLEACYIPREGENRSRRAINVVRGC